MHIPQSYEEITNLSKEAFDELWNRFFHVIPKNTGAPMYRRLWYTIQCFQNKKRISDKYRLKLTNYSKNPSECIERSRKIKYNLKPGSVIIKTYKDKNFALRVISEKRFEYNNQIFESLTAAATAIAGIHTAGPKFFGLKNKHLEALCQK